MPESRLLPAKYRAIQQKPLLPTSPVYMDVVSTNCMKPALNNDAVSGQSDSTDE